MPQRTAVALCKGPPMGKSQLWKSSASEYSATALFHEQGSNLVFVLTLALMSCGLHEACHTCRQAASPATMDVLFFH